MLNVWKLPLLCLLGLASASCDGRDPTPPGPEGGGEELHPSLVGIELKTRDSNTGPIQVPAGSDPEDIAAIRGANAMLEAERRLNEILKKLKVGNDVKFLPFERVASWPYQDGFKGMPESIREYEGKRVAMAGFMLPIDEIDRIQEFYLIESLFSCCYGEPPDVNGYVKIDVKAERGSAYQYEPILVVGTFRVKKIMDEDYCICLYMIENAVVRVIELD